MLTFNALTRIAPLALDAAHVAASRRAGRAQPFAPRLFAGSQCRCAFRSAGQTAKSQPHADGFGRAKRCILVFLNGGPSQLDTFDMKPGAPSEVRGPLAPIATTVPGTNICELLPLLATQADKYRIVRSVTHTDTEHTTSMCTMLTGTYHPRPNVAQIAAAPNDHPHLGAIYSLHHGWRNHRPPFVSLPTLFQPPGNGIWPGQDAGFLGQRDDPFVIRGDKKSARFNLPGLDFPVDLNATRLDGRRHLLAQLDRGLATAGGSANLAEFDQFSQQAFSMLSARNLAQAVDLDREPDSSRDGYGRHLFGQGLLLARRLIEAEIPLVTVYWIDPEPPGIGGGEFDSHGRIYHHMRNRLVPAGRSALSRLFFDLSERGLLADTLVVVMAEFGRTPRINAQAGRDHWPQAQSILLAGAGIPGGTIYGATDAEAAYPVSGPVTPPDLGQTVLHLLGVPAEFELRDQQNRPVPASRGTVIPAPGPRRQGQVRPPAPVAASDAEPRLHVR